MIVEVNLEWKFSERKTESEVNMLVPSVDPTTSTISSSRPTGISLNTFYVEIKEN